MNEQENKNLTDNTSEETTQRKRKLVCPKTTEAWDAMVGRGLEKIKEVANDPERRFSLAKAPKEVTDRIWKSSQETRLGHIHKGKLARIIKPVYEGILSASLTLKEAEELFVSSFYMLVELTKKHKIIHPDIGIMFSYNVLRTVSCRYRFRLRPSKKFKEICDKENLFKYFRPRLTRHSKKFVDKRGETIVDYESILRSFIERDKEEKRINNYKKYTTTK